MAHAPSAESVALAIGGFQSLPEMLSYALESVLEHVHTEAGSVYLVDEKRGDMTVAASRGLSAEVERDFDHLLLGEGLSGRVAQEGVPIVLRSLKDDPRLTRMAARTEGFRGFASMPIRSSSKTYGTLNVHTRCDRTFSDDEIGLLSRISTHIASAVANARLFWQLQASERRFRDIVENAEDLIYLTDASGELVYANPAFERLFGRDVQEFLEAIHPLDRQQLDAGRRAAIAHAVGHTLGFRVSLASGRQSRAFSQITVPLRDESGAIVGVQCIARETARYNHGDAGASHAARRADARYVPPPLERSDAKVVSSRSTAADRRPVELIGESAVMQDVVSTIKRVAANDSTVLIIGESGTGKELVARVLHGESRRRAARFLPINCGAIPETMLETELFGHQQGAFTGAVRDKRGLLEEADGGVLFLDEIGDMPLAMQVRLLRFLEEGEVRRVGSTHGRRVNVRIVSATHRDLAAEVVAGRFRLDLFYRVNVVTIVLPPLRERPSDIPGLAAHFLRRLGPVLNPHVRGFCPEALATLAGHTWPGNVRELEHVVERALNLATGEFIAPADLPRAVTERRPSPTIPMDEKSHLCDALERYRWNHTRTAAFLGISRTTLWRKMREHGLLSQ